MGWKAKSAGVLMGGLAVLGLAMGATPASGESLIGFGVHSWRTVHDLRSEGFTGIKRSGISYLVSYQYNPGWLLKLELDGEYFDKGFGGSTHAAFSPQAYVLLGGFIYGGVGIGTIYSSGFNHSFSNPFYAARAGLNFHLLPRIHLDVNGNYHFKAFNQLKGVNTGTVTVGAAIRVAL
ncbi:MAG TPA: hypothetical protein VHR45_14505 [Thermoanaerobaculia bacterium]|nr:hypothetical protein [Thermoanaerobaculia bacterium]